MPRKSRSRLTYRKGVDARGCSKKSKKQTNQVPQEMVEPIVDVDQEREENQHVNNAVDFGETSVDQNRQDLSLHSNFQSGSDCAHEAGTSRVSKRSLESDESTGLKKICNRSSLKTNDTEQRPTVDQLIRRGQQPKEMLPIYSDSSDDDVNQSIYDPPIILDEMARRKDSFVANECCCFVATTSKAMCPFHDIIEMSAQSTVHQSTNDRVPVENISPFNIEEELDILRNHLSSFSLSDDYIDVEVVPVPVENDEDRRNQMDNALQNDLLDLEGRRLEIERIRNRANQVATYLQAADFPARAHHCGPLSERCPHCNAKYFAAESTTRGTYNKCCSGGKVSLPPVEEHPDELRQLFRGQHQFSREFKSKIIRYNNLFQFASVHANLRDIPGQGPYVYAIQGQVYHHYSDINVNRDQFKYGPVYFLNPDEAVEQRMHNGRHFNVDRELIRYIGNVLHRVNPFARQYRHLHQVYEEQAVEMANRGDQMPNMCLQFVASRRQRDREHDLPQVQEVVAVVPYNEERPPNPTIRVFLTERDNGLRIIDNQSQLIDPFVFPLLFPSGQVGWHIGMPLTHNAVPNERGRQIVTPCQYYAYRLAIRFEDDDQRHFDVFRLASKLTQQYIVSAFLKIEANRIGYVLKKQNTFRAEQYNGLVDYLQHRGEAENVPVGRMVILPSSYQGSPRNQLQRYQDAMAIVAKMGNPSLFITMTANPNWPEIRENLPNGDEPSNHPLLICRVFQMKLQELMKDLTKRHVMGVCIAFIYVIEFQKRGLPHAHILITLRNEDKLQDDVRIDDLISAELPDAEAQPELFQLVGKHMVHGPCGALNPTNVCMEDGRCNSNFPKFWHNETSIRNGKVNYRRRRDGRQVEVRRGNRRYVVDNSFVVPHNAYLLLKYRTHINVEAVVGTMSVKYLHKYFFKGPDQALLRVVEQVNGQPGQRIDYDEVRSYLNGRYLTPPESSWHILQFDMHSNSHHVERLQIHLPGHHGVVFQRGREREAADAVHRTQLTEWFETNRNNHFARQFLFTEFPNHFVWDKSAKHWKPRDRTTKPVVSRLCTVSLKSGELYYLRLLLLHVKGCTSFEEIRTVDGTICDTFQEACRRRNLLAEDREWFRCLTEASHKDMPKQLRQTFAYILLYGTVDDPVALWTHFRVFFLDDFIRRRGLNEDEAETAALQHIRFILNLGGRRLADFGLQEPADNEPLPLVDEPLDVVEERRQARNMVEQLNADQRDVFDLIIRAVENDDEPRRLFFLSGAAGTGKTFLYNAIITEMNGRELPVISIAWTGLAASLLKQGRTVHSRFKIPVPTLDNCTSRISGQSEEARFLREAKLIIWDEVSTSTRIVFNLVDRTLKFLCNNDRPFGGKCVVIGGDFKQCLPVVNNGDRTTVVEACIKSSHLWQLFEPLRLNINMRVEPEEQKFIAWLDRLGNGTLPTLIYGNRRGIVEIPQQCVVDTLDDLILNVFDNLRPGDVPNKAILTPLNADCFDINETIINRWTNVTEKVYFSVDSVETDDPVEANDIQVEHLNSCTPMGLPPHRLRLKTGCIVMLLRNLNVRENLCNGTRLLVHDLADHHIEAEPIGFNGQLSGERVFIPRIDFLTNDNNSLPFTMRRRQFPLRISYAVTINKSQGQTFQSVGIYLPNTVFDHGQLYVAFSRARSVRQVFVCASETAQQGALVAGSNSRYTRNIVYQEIL